jgi:hypothetical protein
MLALLALVIIASQRHAIPAPQGALWPPFPDLERTTQPYDPPVMAGCIPNGASVEINGRNVYRSGHVIGQGQYLFDADAQTFPCMVIADIVVSGGDSGGAVLVDGQPAGVVSRSFADQGQVGFTPLDTGLDELGLSLCTEPDCGLVPPR